MGRWLYRYCHQSIGFRHRCTQINTDRVALEVEYFSEAVPQTDELSQVAGDRWQVTILRATCHLKLANLLCLFKFSVTK